MVLVSSGAPCILGRVGVAGMQRTFLINICFNIKNKATVQDKTASKNKSPLVNRRCFL